MNISGNYIYVRSVCANYYSWSLLSLFVFFWLQIIVDDDGERIWTLYDAGPKAVRCPIVFLPPASGKADVFFKQIIALSTAGYRVIAVSFSSGIILK